MDEKEFRTRVHALKADLQCSCGQGPWTPLPEEVFEDLVRDWRRFTSKDQFEAVLASLEKGHAITSPVHAAFRYRIGGIVGRQMALGIT